MSEIDPGAGVWGALGAVLAGAVAWFAARARRSSSDSVALSEDSARIDTIKLLREERDAAIARAADTDKRADEAEKRERETYTLLVQVQGDLRMAQRDLQRLRYRLKAAGVPDSDYMQHLETDFGHLDDGHHQ